MDQNPTYPTNSNFEPLYNPNDVYQAPQPVQQQFVPSQPTDTLYQQNPIPEGMPPKKSPLGKILVIIIVLFFLGAVGYGGFYLYQTEPELFSKITGKKNQEEVVIPELEENSDASKSAILAPSPSSTASATPSANVKGYIDFYDSTVWLNPELTWAKVIGSEIELADETVAIKSDSIDFTTVQIQGSEWKAGYSSDQDLKFVETIDETKQRISWLGWKKELVINGVTYSSLDVSTDEKKVTTYLREQGNRLQVYAQLYKTNKATGSSEIEQIEERIFLSEPIDLNRLLEPFR